MVSSPDLMLGLFQSIGVSIAPGSTALTRIPLGLPSIADDRVNHLTVLEKNVTPIGVASQGKFAGLSGNTDQLDDVRKGQFFE